MMSDAYIISPKKERTILFVGEGNFTFSKDYITLNEPNISNVEIICTCNEGDPSTFSDLKTSAIEYLKSKGVVVIYNVDATNLVLHPVLKNKKFDKIIFNFPHVGGKMRIDLNRILLKSFFASAKDVLSDTGCVIVALTDGQGGSEADSRQRRWDDSWQITEMAAQSDFILHQVEGFDESRFPEYVNVGFRSSNKGFHCKNAVVHIFKRHEVPLLLKNPYKWISDKSLTEDSVFDMVMDRFGCIFSNPRSAPNYLVDSLKEKLGLSFDTESELLESHSMSVSEDSPDNLSTTQFHQHCIHILNNLQATTDSMISNRVVKIYCKSKPVNLTQFSSAPIRPQAIVFSESDILQILKDWLSNITILFESDSTFEYFENGSVYSIKANIDTNPEDSIMVESVSLPNQLSCCILHLDNISRLIFKLNDWRQLWTGQVIKSSSNKLPHFLPISLYPKAHEFDISLSVPLHIKEEFEQQFFLTLWLLAGDIIVNVVHLSTYLPTDRPLICYCYRITYQSFSSPLFRKRVIEIHEKVVASYICQSLKASLR